MHIVTLLEFASEKTIARLIVKERAKYRHRNNSLKKHTLDRNHELDSLELNEQLSRLSPPRYHWVWPRKREKRNGVSDSRKNAIKAMMLTIRHNKAAERNEDKHFAYLDEMRAFRQRIIERLSDDNLLFESPNLSPRLKDKELQDDGAFKVTCRPMSIYKKLEDKIILALTNMYLTRYFDSYLHENLLSYRKVKYDKVGKKAETIDFSEGAMRIKTFREKHDADTIYVADCDIKKFYDIIPHQTVRDCFQRMLDDHPSLSDEGKKQVMRVLNAYLNSYNFYDNVLRKVTDNPNIFDKVRSALHDKGNKNTYVIGKVDRITDEEYKKRGVPQGGALSLMIANVVLNDVDKDIVEKPDDNRLFLRYCDDMILMHTDRNECQRLIDMYAESLSRHDLVYHEFKRVSDSKATSDKYGKAAATGKDFWKIKSHSPFLWGQGEGDSNLYVGFLGYEIRRDGRMRLRKSNVKKIKEKFNRQRHIIMRHKEKHTAEEYEEFRDKRLQSVLNGLLYYKAFDKETFEHGSQYKYMKKLQEQTRRSVDKYKIDIIKQTHQ